MKSSSSSHLFATVLRWLADFGLGLGAAGYALPEQRESACPFATVLNPVPKTPL